MINIETKKSVEEIRAFLTELQESNNLDLTDYLQNCFSDEELEELDQNNPTGCFESLLESLEENGYFDIEITYYDKAIEYLSKNDPSLIDSLEIANDFGYTIDNLNSETLASLLASEIERNRFYEFRSDIEDFFTNL